MLALFPPWLADRRQSTPCPQSALPSILARSNRNRPLQKVQDPLGQVCNCRNRSAIKTVGGGTVQIFRMLVASEMHGGKLPQPGDGHLNRWVERTSPSGSCHSQIHIGRT
jgi:hypothetical protein